jgi:hypothetical protein
LKPYLTEAIEIGYQKGLALLERETLVDLSQVPSICPFSEAQVFDEPVELEEL